MAVHPLILLLLAALLTAGCDRSPTVPAGEESAAEAVTGNTETAAPKADRQPPAPPLLENFEGEPIISLFPRVAQVRPAEGDELYPFWRTYIDHLRRLTGLVSFGPDDARQHAFGFRGLKSVDSVGYFAPLAVQPGQTYRISARIRCQLPDKVRTGIGVQEFDQFLWIGNQFDAEQEKEHLLRSKVGISLEGNHDWEDVAFDFTTGPKTGMIHLILFLDGPADRVPVLFDDLRIEPID